MILVIKGSSLEILKEITDKRPKNDSHFWFFVRNAFRSRGVDCIKKLAYKDGHLVDNDTHYVRARNGSFYVWDRHYQIRSVARDFWRDGVAYVFLCVRDPAVFATTMELL